MEQPAFYALVVALAVGALAFWTAVEAVEVVWRWAEGRGYFVAGWTMLAAVAGYVFCMTTTMLALAIAHTRFN